MDTENQIHCSINASVFEARVSRKEFAAPVSMAKIVEMEINKSYDESSKANEHRS